MSDLIERLRGGVPTTAQIFRGLTFDMQATVYLLSEAATALSEAQATIARQQVMLDRALEASFDDKALADRAEAENARLKDPRTAARLICDEVLQKSSDEAAAMREAMVKATMGTKVPALTGEVRWSVVNDALRALAVAV